MSGDEMDNEYDAVFEGNDHPTLEDLIHQMESTLLDLNFVSVGDTVLILGGVPLRKARTTSFLDIHTIGELGERPIF
jgi:pyruvate kinase